MKIFVGNLSFGTTEETVRSMFENYGVVDRVTIMTDRETGRSRGFGFVEMGSEGEADKAINSLNGKEVGGRALTVNQARPKESRGFGGGFRESRGGDHRRTQSRW